MTLAVYLSDTFNRGAASVGGAGSTTGVGNGWIDRNGSTYRLDGTHLAACVPNPYTTNWLVRPTSENSVSQRAVVTFSGNTSGQIPIVLLRVDSINDNAYAAFYDGTGTLRVAKFIGGSNTALGSQAISGYAAPGAYIIDFTAVPNAAAGTDLTAVVFAAGAPATALATVTVIGDTTAVLQTPLSYGLSGANDFPGATSAVLYSAAAPALAVNPGSSTVAGASATQSLTATLTGSLAALSASVSGGGTLSTTTPTSGVAFTYTGPASGSGTATVTVTDAADGLTATAAVAYALAPSMTSAPTIFPLGAATAFTLTGANTSWVSTTRPTVSGGTGAYVSNMVRAGQVLTGTLNPGTATGTLTLGNSTDSATVALTAAANVANNIVWHGDSLTYGQNGSAGGTIAATRVAAVLQALGPTWQGTNYGNAGHTLGQMLMELGSAVNGLYDASKQSNILVVQGGHNDIRNATGTPGQIATTVITAIKAYVAAALAAHPWKIVWSTQPPAAFPGVYPALFDSIRDTVNAYMRLNWQSLGITALADFAMDARMGMPGCQYNASYYSGTDFTHPNDVGYAIWGAYDLAAVNSIFGALPKRWSHS